MKKPSSSKKAKSKPKKKPIMRHSRDGVRAGAKRKPIMRHSREG